MLYLCKFEIRNVFFNIFCLPVDILILSLRLTYLRQDTSLQIANAVLYDETVAL